MTSLELKRASLYFRVRVIEISKSSPIILNELQKALGTPYMIATRVILKYEIDLKKIAWYGLTELRDVTIHIANAVNSNDENEALLEIEYAKEHIRRAALETLHEYASDLFNELQPRLEGSTFKYRLLMLPPPNPKRVQELKEQIQNHLLEARLSRGTNWVKSVDNFNEAINNLRTLSTEVPPISDVRWRIFGFIIGVLTIITTISTILFIPVLIKILF